MAGEGSVRSRSMAILERDWPGPRLREPSFGSSARLILTSEQGALSRQSPIG